MQNGLMLASKYLREMRALQTGHPQPRRSPLLLSDSDACASRPGSQAISVSQKFYSSIELRNPSLQVLPTSDLYRGRQVLDWLFELGTNFDLRKRWWKVLEWLIEGA